MIRGDTMTRPHAMKQHRDERGFSYIELAVVLMIVATLASFGIANFIQFRGRAQAAACIIKQRLIVEAVMIYVGEQTPLTNIINSKYLVESKLIRAETAECPNSGDDNYTDYQVTLDGRQIKSVECLIRTKEHAYHIF